MRNIFATYMTKSPEYFFPLLVYLFILERKRGGERERERTSKEGAEREEERIPSRFHTVSTEPDSGLKPMNCQIMT